MRAALRWKRATPDLIGVAQGAALPGVHSSSVPDRNEYPAVWFAVKSHGRVSVRYGNGTSGGMGMAVCGDGVGRGVSGDADRSVR